MSSRIYRKRTIDFSWPETNANLISPQITLENIPVDTRKLSINMYDLDNSYHHGGGTVYYNGVSVVVEGALDKYEGPSPFYGSPRYELSVKAIDENGNVIGFGKKMKRFPPVPE